MSFRDTKGRDITIEVYGDSAYARHNGKQVGFVHTSGLQEVDDHSPWLPAVITGWEVDAHYRREGIATALVEALVQELGVLAPGHKNIGIGGTNALTEEGEAITRHCQKLGLISHYPEERADTEWYE